LASSLHPVREKPGRPAGLLMHGARAHQAGCRHGPLPKSHLLSITQSTRTPAPIRICEFPSLPFPGQARQAIIVVSLIQRCMLRTDFPVGDYCGEHLVCSSCTGCRLCLCRAAVYTAQRTGDGEVNEYRYRCAAEVNEYIYRCAAEVNELSNVW
jgi:hypothetical protein